MCEDTVKGKYLLSLIFCVSCVWFQPIHMNTRMKAKRFLLSSTDSRWQRRAVWTTTRNSLVCWSESHEAIDLVILRCISLPFYSLTYAQPCVHTPDVLHYHFYNMKLVYVMETRTRPFHSIHLLYQFTHLYEVSVTDDLLTQMAYNKLPTKFSSSSIVSLAQVARCYPL